MKLIKTLIVFAAIILSMTASASRYESVAEDYANDALSKESIANAKMQGECLVQLKELTFKKKNTFDPISEWINYRSVSLLQQFSPCEVLIMMEVANEQLRNTGENDANS